MPGEKESLCLLCLPRGENELVKKREKSFPWKKSKTRKRLGREGEAVTGLQTKTEANSDDEDEREARRRGSGEW